jgi:hypothetical protein
VGVSENDEGWGGVAAWAVTNGWIGLVWGAIVVIFFRRRRKRPVLRAADLTPADIRVLRTKAGLRG